MQIVNDLIQLFTAVQLLSDCALQIPGDGLLVFQLVSRLLSLLFELSDCALQMPSDVLLVCQLISVGLCGVLQSGDLLFQSDDVLLDAIPMMPFAVNVILQLTD